MYQSYIIEVYDLAFSTKFFEINFPFLIFGSNGYKKDLYFCITQVVNNKISWKFCYFCN